MITASTLKMHLFFNNKNNKIIVKYIILKKDKQILCLVIEIVNTKIANYLIEKQLVLDQILHK